MFSVESLKVGITKCKVNIETFEEAIQKERDTITEYHGMIETIQEKERQQREFETRVEVVRDGSD